MTTEKQRAEQAVQDRWGKEDFQKKLECAFWKNHPVVLGHLNRLATTRRQCDWLTWFSEDCLPRDRQLRVLVLGCGEGWLERSIAGLSWIERIDAYDVAVGAVQRAEQRARDEGLDSIHYGVLDLNTESLAPSTYDAVIAHSVLHHIESLEHAFATIRDSLKPGGWMAINEYVGPPHLQYRDEAMALMNRVMAVLEPRLRYGLLSGGTLEQKEKPALDYVLEVDPSEGVRADELDDFIRATFDVVYERPMGGTVLQHLLYELVANFDQEDATDNCLLEWICLLEESLTDWAGLPSDYQFYVCRRKGEGEDQLAPREAIEVARTRAEPRPPTDWRSHLAAKSYFHQLATGDKDCDWLTKILAELEDVGLGRSSSVLWLGGQPWMLDVLEQRFDHVVPFSWNKLLRPGRFDAAFGCQSYVLHRSNRRRMAAVAAMLKPTGSLVAIEERGGSASRAAWVDRFARPLGDLAGSADLPPSSGAAEEVGLPGLFQIERPTVVSGGLVEELMDTYADALPEERLDELIRLLAVVEAEALATGEFKPKRQGFLFAGPERRKVLRRLLTG